MSSSGEIAVDINRRATIELHEAARDLRMQFIRDVFSTAQLALLKQDEHFDELSVDFATPDLDKRYDYYVLEDFIHLPIDRPEAQHSLSVYLTGPLQEVGQKPSLTLYVPCSEEVTIDEHSDHSLLVEPDFVVVRELRTTGSDAWYIVHEDGVLPYIPEAVSGQEHRADELPDDDITEEQMALMIIAMGSKKVDSGVSLISHLREQLVEMSLTVQRSVKDGKVTDHEAES